MKQQQPWYYSWPVIIIAFILFWPVGIALLVMKSRSSKQSVFVGSSDKKFYIIIGVVLVLMGIGTMGKSPVTGLFMIIGGIALIVYAGQMAKRAKRNKQYIDMIVNQQITSLDKIASVNNISYENVLKEVKQLISLGVLKGAQIDEMRHTIMVAQPERPQMAPPQYQQGYAQNDIPQAPQFVTVACPGCGAKMSVQRGTTVSCEYCDTPVSGR